MPGEAEQPAPAEAKYAPAPEVTKEEALPQRTRGTRTKHESTSAAPGVAAPQSEAATKELELAKELATHALRPRTTVHHADAEEGPAAAGGDAESGASPAKTSSPRKNDRRRPAAPARSAAAAGEPFSSPGAAASAAADGAAAASNGATSAAATAATDSPEETAALAAAAVAAASALARATFTLAHTAAARPPPPPDPNGVAKGPSARSPANPAAVRTRREAPAAGSPRRSPRAPINTSRSEGGARRGGSGGRGGGSADAATSAPTDGAAAGSEELVSLAAKNEALGVTNTKLLVDKQLLVAEVKRLALQVQHLTAQQAMLQGELQRLLSQNTNLNSALASTVTQYDCQTELVDILSEAVRTTVLRDDGDEGAASSTQGGDKTEAGSEAPAEAAEDT